jgi:hypothetical protein
MGTQLPPYLANIRGPYYAQSMEQFGSLPPRQIELSPDQILSRALVNWVAPPTITPPIQKPLDPNRFTVPTSKSDISPPPNQLTNQPDRTSYIIIACWGLFATLCIASMVWRTSLATRCKIAISLSGGTAIIILGCVNQNIGGIALVILGWIAFVSSGSHRPDSGNLYPPDPYRFHFQPLGPIVSPQVVLPFPRFFNVLFPMQGFLDSSPEGGLLPQDSEH